MHRLRAQTGHPLNGHAGSELGLRELEVAVAGHDPESLGFAQRRGFTKERREVGLVLSLTGLSPAEVPPPGWRAAGRSITG
jgi:hypothetical protein